MRRFSYPGDIYNATPARVVFGPGSAAGAKAEVARLGATRALVISTPGRGALAESVAANLDELGVGLLDEAVPQVPIELAVKARAKASAAGADCLVSVGGGSATGLAKAIALDLALPIVAIPTTYAGSEMTGFCGITIDGVKRMHTSLRMVPSTVVYDAELSVSLPPSVSAASAMNGLAHCVDAIYLPHLSPLLAHAAVEGAKVIATQIPRMLSDPRSLDTRNELLYGAYLGGAALTSGYALQHDLAHALGGSLGIEHGLAHALVLPHVAAYNQRFAPQAL
ncbi:MAG: iron-containing alcohol dehydrogenase, partial [Micromonosporaceae bacterium]